MFFRRAILLILYRLSDVFILFVSAAVALFAGGDLKQPADLDRFLSGMTLQGLAVIAAAVLIWHIVFLLLGLYETKRFGRKFAESIDILKATSLGTCITTGIVSLFYPWILNTLFIFAFWISASVLTILTRMLMRLTLTVLRFRGRNLRFIVIVGTNKRAMNFVRNIRAHKEMGYHILGFVDNECKTKPDAIKLLSDLNHFSDVLDRHVVDEVVIALPMKSFYSEITEILNLCQEQGLKVRFIADMLFDPSAVKSAIEYMDGVPFFTMYMGPHDGFLLRVKRVMDIVGSAAALFLLAPVFLIIAVLIRWDSPGPVFFVHERVGYNKRRFPCFKFRTMTAGAEQKQAELEKLNEVNGPAFKIKDDPRVTKIGKFLRKASIDEWPQFFNVLKGDMSLVGPRPLPIRDYNLFDKNWQKRRFSVKPGLTCLWQIQGRSNLSFEKWIELDMMYIDQWSLLLDLKILIKTIPAVLKGTGAV